MKNTKFYSSSGDIRDVVSIVFLIIKRDSHIHHFFCLVGGS
jgi:hypothetical protein